MKNKIRKLLMSIAARIIGLSTKNAEGIIRVCGKRITKWLLPLLVVFIGYRFIHSWLTLILLFATASSLVLLALILARLDIFFTLVEEGTAKVIMTMEGFSRIIMQYRGNRIDKNGDVVEDKEKKEIHLFGGLRWIGIPFYHSIYKYHFRWKSLRVQSGEIIPREEEISYVLVKDDVYVAEIKNAESNGMVPLDIILLLTARCINPYKALFRAQDWMEMIINRSEAIFREYVAQYSFEQLVAKRQKVGGEIWKKLTEAELTGENGLFLTEYGIDIKGVEMRDINPSGKHKELYEEAASKKWVAQQDAKRIKITAKADRARIDTVYKTIEQYGELGKAIRFMESLEGAGQKQGNWIIPFDLRQIFGGFFGRGKPCDDRSSKGGN